MSVRATNSPKFPLKLLHRSERWESQASCISTSGRNMEEALCSACSMRSGHWSPARQSGRFNSGLPQDQFQWMSLSPATWYSGQMQLRREASVIRTSWLGKAPVGFDQEILSANIGGAQGKLLERGKRLLGKDIQQRTHLLSFICTLTGKFLKVRWKGMHFIYACIHWWSMPMEHGFKNHREVQS